MKNETADNLCRIIVLGFLIPTTIGSIIGTIYSAIKENPMTLFYTIPACAGLVYFTRCALKDKF